MAATLKRPRTMEEMIAAEKAALAGGDPGLQGDQGSIPKPGDGYPATTPITSHRAEPSLAYRGMGGIAGYTSERPKMNPDTVGLGVEKWLNDRNQPGRPTPLVREPGVAPLYTDPSEIGPPEPPAPAHQRMTGGDTRAALPKFGSGAMADAPLALPALSTGDKAAEAVAGAGRTLSTAFNPMIRKGGFGNYFGRPLVMNPGEKPLIADPSQMGPPEPPQGGASFGGMGDVRAVEGAADKSAAVAGHSASTSNDDRNMVLMRQRSAQLLRDMYAKGTTPEQHAALARERAEIEGNLDYYRKGLATRSAPAPLSGEQIAASKASLDNQAAGGDSTFQGPIQSADPGMVDRVNASRQDRFDSEGRRREAGLGVARQFGDAYAGSIADRTALAEASMKANVASEQARGAVAGAVTRSGGLTPEQMVAEATAQSEIARMNREKAAMEGTGGSTPEAAAAAQQSRQAALSRYGVGEDFQKILDNDLAIIDAGMSDIRSGKVAGNMWGGAEGMSKAVDSLNTNISILERMASTDPVVASQFAADVLNALPLPGEDGGYSSSWGGGSFGSNLASPFPINQRNRRMTAAGLTRARQRLMRIKG